MQCFSAHCTTSKRSGVFNPSYGGVAAIVVYGVCHMIRESASEDMLTNARLKERIWGGVSHWFMSWSSWRGSISDDSDGHRIRIGRGTIHEYEWLRRDHHHLWSSPSLVETPTPRSQRGTSATFSRGMTALFSKLKRVGDCRSKSPALITPASETSRLHMKKNKRNKRKRVRYFGVDKCCADD